MKFCGMEIKFSCLVSKKDVQVKLAYDGTFGYIFPVNRVEMVNFENDHCVFHILATRGPNPKMVSFFLKLIK